MNDQKHDLYKRLAKLAKWHFRPNPFNIAKKKKKKTIKNFKANPEIQYQIQTPNY